LNGDQRRVADRGILQADHLAYQARIMTPDMTAGLSSAAQIVGVVQSPLGGLLLFLLSLALRNRFRMS
jgi:hypothetical protein